MAEVRTKVDALKDLGKKVTGKDIDVEENETIVGMLDKITKEYEGGGSGGTSDYTDLSNKPKINNVELAGNKTTSDLGINNVTANPTLAGGESNLTSIQVGDTKYAISSGGGGGTSGVLFIDGANMDAQPNIDNFVDNEMSITSEADVAMLEAINTAYINSANGRADMPLFLYFGTDTYFQAKIIRVGHKYGETQNNLVEVWFEYQEEQPPLDDVTHYLVLGRDYNQTPATWNWSLMGASIDKMFISESFDPATSNTITLSDYSDLRKLNLIRLRYSETRTIPTEIIVSYYNSQADIDNMYVMKVNSLVNYTTTGSFDICVSYISTQGTVHNGTFQYYADNDEWTYNE